MVSLQVVSTSLFLLIACVVTVASQDLYILPAGLRNTANGFVKKLKTGASICPKNYKKGFTIECRGNVHAPVFFFVNDRRYNIVRKKPYALAGYDADTDVLKAYNSFKIGAEQKLECISIGSPTVSVTVKFGCNDGQTSTEKLRWLWPKNNCVVVNASNPLNSVPSDWERVKNGLTYKPDDMSGVTVKADTAPLNYSFRVPEKGHYAVSLDMTTRDWIKHNDVYLRFKYGGGLQLRKKSSLTVGRKNYLRAFHNQNGRATEASTIENNKHSISTLSELVPGQRYFLWISARSTRVTVHNIILFKCEDLQCSWTEPYWKNKIQTCKL